MAAGGSFPVISGPAVSGPRMNTVVQAPPSPTLTQSAGGALAATTYFVKTTYVTAQGESAVSAENSFAASLNNVLNVASPPAQLGPDGVNAPLLGYNVYVSNTGGGGSGAETKQNGGTPVAIGTAWIEPTSGLVGGAAMPTVSAAIIPAAAQPMGQPYPTNLEGPGSANAARQGGDTSGRGN